jgi:BirA family biotin operon repressor/biotin-[acetyl-CoA-carboxylase] ligase
MNGEWQEAVLPAGYRLEHREVTGSTNDDVRGAARAGAAAGLVVVAEVQQAGRGRRGAAWVCPPGEGLAFSVLLRPAEKKELWPRLSLVAGLAVAEALDRCGVFAEVKWPNDIWIGGRKVCGILVEAGEDFVVVGIGLNVGVRGFPDALADNATSLAIECGEAPARAAVLAAVLERLQVWQGCIGGRFGEPLRRLRERCALSGQRVRMSRGEEVLSGEALGIGDGGELLLRDASGIRKIVQADEVRVLADL